MVVLIICMYIAAANGVVIPDAYWTVSWVTLGVGVVVKFMSGFVKS